MYQTGNCVKDIRFERIKNRETVTEIKEPSAIWAAVLAFTFTCCMFEVSDLIENDKERLKKKWEKRREN